MQESAKHENKPAPTTNGLVLDFTVPGLDRDTYEAINDQVFGNGLPDGLRYHAAWETESGWRILEEWASEEQWGRYAAKVLQPVLAKHGAPEPAMTMKPVVRTYSPERER